MQPRKDSEQKGWEEIPQLTGQREVERKVYCGIVIEQAGQAYPPGARVGVGVLISIRSFARSQVMVLADIGAG